MEQRLNWTVYTVLNFIIFDLSIYQKLMVYIVRASEFEPHLKPNITFIGFRKSEGGFISGTLFSSKSTL